MQETGSLGTGYTTIPDLVSVASAGTLSNGVQVFLAARADMPPGDEPLCAVMRDRDPVRARRRQAFRRRPSASPRSSPPG